MSNVGAKKVVIAAPAFPIPKIPRARPCQFLGYHTEVKATPTAKPVPTIPKRILKMKYIQYELTECIKKKGIAQKMSSELNTGLPPYLSVNIPIKGLKIEPESIGKPNSQPVSTTLQLKTLLSTK